MQGLGQFRSGILAAAFDLCEPVGSCREGGGNLKVT